IDRIGGKRPIQVDVRIIATSNRNMEAEVAAKRFREDLFYRLNVVMIEIPSLKDRPGDIEPLASLQLLKTHAWPGNVRELENTLHRGVLLSSAGVIGPDAIRLHGSAASAAAAAAPANMVGRTVSDVERDLIIDTLEHCLGNRTHAATILGISIRTLRNKLKLYNQEGYAVPLAGDGGSRPNA
ncbi:MAG: Two-component response regulator, partial [Rhodospirillales bacterium]|nr:Two-component response regulator [Rhodospirillales bacterium]